MRENLLRKSAYAAVILWAATGIIHNLGRPAMGAPGMLPTGNVVAVGDGLVLSTNGRVYVPTNGPGSHWYDTGSPALPIPVDQVAEITGSGSLIIDTGGNGWHFTDARWHSLGPVPGTGGPINVDPSTWSKIKTLGK